VEHAAWLKDVVVFLAAAGLVVPFFHRARIGAVLGFLLVGVAVGPDGLSRFSDVVPWLRYVTIDDAARVEPFADLGIIILLFLLGLDLTLGRLWTLKRFVFGVGALQVICCATAIAAVVALAGIPWPAPAVLGPCLALSSTAIVMQILIEQHRSSTLLGRVALSVLLFQDLMVVPILAVTNMLGRGVDFDPRHLAIVFGTAVAAVALIMVAGRFALRPLLRFAAQTGSRDLLLAITLLIVVSVAGTTHAAGLSTALGAFMAGLLLSETEYRHQIEVDLEPFKGLLLGLFFMTVGMSVDIDAAWDYIGWILLGVVVLLAIKGAMIFGLASLFGLRRAVAIELALLLSQGGEFAFVVISLARGYDLLPPAVATGAVATVALSMMATPLLAGLARRARTQLDGLDYAEHAPQDSAEFRDHVVIGGFGRAGQTVARLLESESIAYVALDLDGERVAAERKAGRQVFFGDASRRELLERAGAAHARAFVVTLDTPGAAEGMVEAVRAIKPESCVIARAKDLAQAEQLVRLGAVGVVPEAVEASLQLARRLLLELDVPDEVVDRRIDDAREAALGPMTEVTSSS
jgi:CPA2 family monovalent cation:H+ antiporter-2